MIKIIFNGIGGRIGHAMYKHLLGSDEFKIVAGIDKFANKSEFDFPVYDCIGEVVEAADVIIDFSVADALDELLEYAVSHKINIIVATTGHSEKQLKKIREASDTIAVFKTSNMSLGVNILTSLAKEAAAFLGSDYDVEIIEQHHNLKYDSPSGTAVSIAEAINSVRNNSCEFVYGRHFAHQRRKQNEIGIHAVRGGSIVGKHDVLYIGAGEVITLSHESQNKEVFAIGALRAAAFLADKKTGLFNMNSIIGAAYAVTNVSVDYNITLINIPKITSQEFNNFLRLLENKNVNIDMISQTLNNDDTVAVSLTLPDSANEIAFSELFSIKTPYTAKEHTAKLTSEGAGMAHQCGVAKEVFNLITSAGAAIFSITTSETKISCCVNADSATAAEKAVRRHYNI